MSFEAALADLEGIVARLEGGKAPLAESIAIYERGEALKSHCEGLLKAAEARIEAGAGQLLPPGQGGAQAPGQEGGVELGLGVGRQQPGGDEGARIDVAGAHGLALPGHDGRFLAGLEVAHGALGRVDLVGEDPEVAGLQAALSRRGDAGARGRAGPGPSRGRGRLSPPRPAGRAPVTAFPPSGRGMA